MKKTMTHTLKILFMGLVLTGSSLAMNRGEERGDIFISMNSETLSPFKNLPIGELINEAYENREARAYLCEKIAQGFLTPFYLNQIDMIKLFSLYPS